MGLWRWPYVKDLLAPPYKLPWACSSFLPHRFASPSYSHCYIVLFHRLPCNSCSACLLPTVRPGNYALHPSYEGLRNLQTFITRVTFITPSPTLQTVAEKSYDALCLPSCCIALATPVSIRSVSSTAHSEASTTAAERCQPSANCQQTLLHWRILIQTS